MNPQGTFYGIKRLMGKLFSEVSSEVGKTAFHIVSDTARKNIAAIEFNGNLYSPQEISAKILLTLKKEAEMYLGQKVGHAVISVPAYFNHAQRQATLDAAQIAGFNQVKIINEPMAAALAYSLNMSKTGKVAVYDFGGGTFDFSVLDINDGVFEVLTSLGNTLLGGCNIDFAIREFILKEIYMSANIDIVRDLDKNAFLVALQRITIEVENAKKSLSSTSNYEINLPYLAMKNGSPLNFTYILSRAKLEQIAKPFIEQSIELCKKAMNDARITTKEIEHIIVVGGTSKMPLVQQMVESLFLKKPAIEIDPEKAVALGAAIQAGIMIKQVEDILILDAIALSLGIETLGGVMTKLIERNTTLPVRKSQTFSTSVDNQTFVSFLLYQGEREMAKDNKLLGTFHITNIPPAPRGVPQLEISFDVDANGVLNISGKELKTMKELSIIAETSDLSKEEVQKIIQAAGV